MYSYEDRTRAVELYIKLGKRATATIRQLGYQTKRALTDWHREYEQHHELPAGYVRSKPKYSGEQKAVAVAHYLNHGRCLAVTLKALGYPGDSRPDLMSCTLKPGDALSAKPETSLILKR